MNLNSKRYIGAGLILAALLPLSHGSRLLSAQNTFMQESIQRTANVIDHAPEAGDRTGQIKRAVSSIVEFTDDTGERRTANTNVASYPPPTDIGDQIEVRIHHTRLDDVRVVSFTGLWFESAFYLVPGLLTLLVGIYLAWSQRKPI
ncbi:MAG: DUF3592 domain-containing protein [Granulosicoccus sp.]